MRKASPFQLGMLHQGTVRLLEMVQLGYLEMARLGSAFRQETPLRTDL